MAKNTRYARLAENNSIEYSPRTFKEGGEIIVPRVDDDEAYFSRGWYLVVDVVPEYDRQTQYVKSKTWVVIQSIHTINAQYEIDDIPQEEKVKRYSKLKLTLFCMQQNLWADVKAFLEKIGYYDLFVMAQYFLETDEYFQQGINLFKQAMIDKGTAEDVVQHMIDEMKDFAFDGFEYA